MNDFSKDTNQVMCPIKWLFGIKARDYQNWKKDKDIDNMGKRTKSWRQRARNEKKSRSNERLKDYGERNVGWQARREQRTEWMKGRVSLLLLERRENEAELRGPSSTWLPVWKQDQANLVIQERCPFHLPHVRESLGVYIYTASPDEGILAGQSIPDEVASQTSLSFEPREAG